MPRAILRVVYAAKEQRTVFRWNDGEEAGHGNVISGDERFMADCVIVCFVSICFVLSGSFCLFVILFPLVSTADLRVDDFPVDDLCGRSL
jgi:hypothetical protein